MHRRLFLYGILTLFACGCGSTRAPESPVPGGDAPWRGIHLIGYTDDAALEELAADMSRLAEMGINTIVLEVDYHFAYASHPELRQGDTQITPEGARAFARTCRAHGIRLVPQFQCIAHQSWAETTFPLLIEYPEFDLTPGAFPGNQGEVPTSGEFYCREWDPTNPDVHPIIFRLMDELIDAFEADAFHVGMDEIFLLGLPESPSTYGKDPAEILAQAINEYHDHLVGERGVEMMMWADRLIDGAVYDFGRWESALNGTAPAVDMIPKDIVMIPWHYTERDAYPSIPMFLEKGFRVWPASWRDPVAAEALIAYSLAQDDPDMLGHLFTTWSRPDTLTAWTPMVRGLDLLAE